VIPEERGVIDNEAWVHFGNVNVKADYQATDRISVFFRGGYFSEDRSNGKIDEVNDTRWKTATGGIRSQLPDGSDLQARIFGDFATFHSTFLAVPATTPARNAVRLTLDQRVPTDSVGGMVQWARSAGRSHFITAGGDWRWVDGDSLEDAYNQLGPIVSPVTGAVLALQRNSGGAQRSLGAFVQDVFTPASRLVVTLSARVDSWRNYAGHNLETNVVTGQPVPVVVAPNGLITGNRPQLPDRKDTVISPRAAALYHVTEQVSVWAGLSSGFRAPTLNELYRQFAVGVLRTFANEALTPEHLLGGEAGISAEPVRNVVVRATYYDNRVKDPVANVTIGTNQLQRQNLGRTQIRGLQTDVNVTVGEYVRVSGGYLFNDAKVREFSANPALVGNYLPQVPKHRGSFQIAFAHPRLFNVGFGAQFLGRQFDDDQNIRTVPGETEPGLPGYAILDLTASRSVTRNIEVFFGAQNLLYKEYIVMTQPTTTGSPRLVHGGVRVRFAGR
jgi:outer membrane receptor protein involved in Fe transport